MSKYMPGNQKHLTLNDRLYIEHELTKGTFYNARNICLHHYPCQKSLASELKRQPLSKL